MLPFTPRLRIAIAFAEIRQPREVSCLALLDGIMSLGGGVAVNILKSKGIAGIDSTNTSKGHAITDDTPVQYSACGLTALSKAITEAVSRSHQLVGVEHMLVGILTSGCSEVVEMFTQKGVILDDVLSELRKDM